MQFRYVVGVDAGLEVEIVHVLGDEKVELSHVFQFLDGVVTGVGLRGTKVLLRRSQSPVPPRPDTIRAPEIPQAGLRADARPGEDDDVPRLGHPSRQFFDIAIHCLPVS